MPHPGSAIDIYSLRNLVDLHSGLLLPQLTKAIRKAIKHVKKCPLCCQKRFVCEICQSPSVIYPFQLDETFQCKDCKALYHKRCRRSAGCPKCKRLEKRKHLFDDSSLVGTHT
ncbi:protein associated with UVRAG as autophagy enhancer-like isoform X2 [Dysidea avara]|uniref:protein associated with UVRAG as autophagy enhancer-like isoform X2 n=1 Tax=Dysidea avara TaxID=196820 RepID=UPI00332B4CB6